MLPLVRARAARSLPRSWVALLLAGVVAACAYGNDPAPLPRSTALPPPPPGAAGGPVPQATPLPATPLPGAAPAARAAGTPAGASPATISACRAEAERGAVTRNRGDLMRLDGRDVDLSNSSSDRLFAEQVRGFAQQDRDRLFRECMAREGAGPTR